MRHLALLAGAVATLAFWYLLDDVSLLGLIAVSAYVFSPWLLLALERTPLRDPARGVALVAFSVLTIEVYRSADDSSTAAIGLAFLPFYLWVVAGVVVFADALLQRWASISRERL